MIVETNQGKDFKESETIKAGETKNLRALINVPKGWKDEEITIYLYFLGQEYEYIWNKKRN